MNKSISYNPKHKEKSVLDGTIFHFENEEDDDFIHPVDFIPSEEEDDDGEKKGNSGEGDSNEDEGKKPKVVKPKKEEEDTPELFDEEGNLVDVEGKILKTKEELDSDSSEEEEEEEDNEEGEDVKTFYNKNGDLINIKGEVVKTKETLEKERLAELTVVQEVTELLGVEIKDTEGKVIEYPDTSEGLADMVRAIVEQQVPERLNSILDSRPQVVKDFEKHYELTKDAKSFLDTPFRGLDSISITDDNPTQSKDIIRKYYEALGQTTAQALKQVEKSEAIDAIKEDAEFALTQLKEMEVKEREQNEAKITAMRQAEKDEVEQLYKKVNNIISQGKVSDFKIPVAERPKFLAYLTEPVRVLKDGTQLSQHDLDVREETVEQDLALAFQRFHKYDLSKIVTDKLNSQRVKSITDKIRKSSNPKNSSKTTRIAKTKNEEIDFDKIYENS